MKHPSESGVNLVETESKAAEKERELAELDDEPPPVANMGCGFGRCRPRFLQCFAKPVVFMIVLNMYCILGGTIASGECYCVNRGRCSSRCHK